MIGTDRRGERIKLMNSKFSLYIKGHTNQEVYYSVIGGLFTGRLTKKYQPAYSSSSSSSFFNDESAPYGLFIVR